MLEKVHFVSVICSKETYQRHLVTNDDNYRTQFHMFSRIARYVSNRTEYVKICPVYIKHCMYKEFSIMVIGLNTFLINCTILKSAF